MLPHYTFLLLSLSFTFDSFPVPLASLVVSIDIHLYQRRLRNGGLAHNDSEINCEQKIEFVHIFPAAASKPQLKHCCWSDFGVGVD